MCLARGQNIVVWLFLLHDTPHTLNLISHEASSRVWNHYQETAMLRLTKSPTTVMRFVVEQYPIYQKIPLQKKYFRPTILTQFFCDNV